MNKTFEMELRVVNCHNKMKALFPLCEFVFPQANGVPKKVLFMRMQYLRLAIKEVAALEALYNT